MICEQLVPLKVMHRVIHHILYYSICSQSGKYLNPLSHGSNVIMWHKLSFIWSLVRITEKKKIIVCKSFNLEMVCWLPFHLMMHLRKVIFFSSCVAIEFSLANSFSLHQNSELCLLCLIHFVFFISQRQGGSSHLFWS